MNKPYVKQHNEKGELLNPINGKYVNKHPNRSIRRMKEPRFRNNKNTIPTVIHFDPVKKQFTRFYKTLQRIVFFNEEEDKVESRIIEHYKRSKIHNKLSKLRG